MAEETVPICRLCLEVVYDGRFQEAESIIIILQNVLPNLNFSVSSHPLICNKCTETLHKLFNFKSACLETEKHLQNYRSNGSSIIQLAEMIHDKCLENEVKMGKIDKGKICRFCLKILEGEGCVQLGVIEEDMLVKCLPELDLTVSENPVICETCLECLQNQFNFVMSCSDVEERIENYCLTQGTNSDGQVNLQDILMTPLKTHTVKFNQNDPCNVLRDVKEEPEDKSSSNMEQSNVEYDEIFIKDEVKTESENDDLGFSDDNTSSDWLDAYNPNYFHNNVEKPSHELDHDYVFVNPSLSNSNNRLPRLSKRCKMKDFTKPSKDTQTISTLRKTIVRLEKKLKSYETKYQKASEKLNYIKCLLQELKQKKLISEEAYLEITECK